MEIDIKAIGEAVDAALNPHALIVTPDDVYPSLLWGACACAGWRTAGATRARMLVDRGHTAHLASLEPQPETPVVGTYTMVRVGDTVIAWDMTTSVTYGGVDEHGSTFTIVIGRGVNSMTVLCPPDRVAPAGTPLADAKDPRLSIEKGKGPSWLGNWRLNVPANRIGGSWHKTKRDAVAEGQRRLAIADWHTAHDDARHGTT
jgi:hypothetical protein